MKTVINEENMDNYIEMEEYNIETGETKIYYMPDYPEESINLENSDTNNYDSEDSIILGTVIGKDTRERVEETTRVPYKYIGYLVVTYQTTNNRPYDIKSTGFLVGQATVLTTGHSVHNRNKGDKLLSVKFYPEQNGFTNRPFEYDGLKLHVPTKYKHAKDKTIKESLIEEYSKKYDYALIELKQRAGAKLGYFNLGGYNTSYNENYLVGKDVTVVGYPNDKNGQLFRAKGSILNFNDEKYFFEYDMDTYEGQSGSPLILPLTGGRYYVVGIHYWGKNYKSDMTEEQKKKASYHNRARYITKNIYELVNKYNNGGTNT